MAAGRTTERVASAPTGHERQPWEMADEEFCRWLGGLLIGNAPAMHEARRRISRFRHSLHPVLVSGARGTGKELAAIGIHRGSPRGARALERARLVGFRDPAAAQSFLFGHTKGAFTDAKEKRMGRFQMAAGSSIFLDELHHAHSEVQPLLFDAVDKGLVEPYGGEQQEVVDVRVIAATNVSLRAKADLGEFYADLLDRIGVLRLAMPNLRDHMEDVPLYVNAVLDSESKTLARGAWHVLEEYDWPGNVRELESVIKFAATLSDGPIITAGLVDQCIVEIAEREVSRTPPRALTPEALAHALQQTRNVTSVARLFGVKKQVIYRRMRRWGLSREPK